MADADLTNEAPRSQLSTRSHVDLVDEALSVALRWQATSRSYVMIASRLTSALKESGSIIAGGFVLGAIRNESFKGTDIDIYTPYNGRKKMLSMLSSWARIVSIHQSTPYDTSFFKRNGILIRLTFSIVDTKIDLLILEEDRDVISVVENFDLSFCSVYYDGKEVKGNIEAAISGEGILNPAYLDSLFEGNRFTLGRMRKYRERGFKISIPVGETPFRVHVEPTIEELFRSMLLERIIKSSFYELRYVGLVLDFPELITSNLGELLNELDRFGQVRCGVKDFSKIFIRANLHFLETNAEKKRFRSCDILKLINDLKSNSYIVDPYLNQLTIDIEKDSRCEKLSSLYQSVTDKSISIEDAVELTEKVMGRTVKGYLY